MIIHAKLILFIVCVVELIIKFTLFLKIKRLSGFTLKLIRLSSLKKVSDVWKEKALFNYSKNIFFSSIQVLIILLLIFIFYIFIIHLNKSVYEYFFSIYGIVETSVLAIIYFKLRIKRYE